VKIILLFLFIFVYQNHYSNSNEIENLPIIKKLDKKYLDLIDKDGRITDLKEFNKNGVVVVFEGINFDIDRKLYMFIEQSVQTDKHFNFKGTYTTDLLLDFKNNPYCNNETDEYIIPYIDIKLNLSNFTFKEVKFDNFNQQQKQIITQLYNKKDFNNLLPFISGYVQCGVKIYSNKLVNKIKKLLKIL